MEGAQEKRINTCSTGNNQRDGTKGMNMVNQLDWSLV